MGTFPTQLDDKEQLLRLLGGFWSDTYQGQSFLSEALLARTTLTKQTFDRLQEAIDCRSRLDVPLFRKEYWRFLSVKQSIISDFPNLYGEDTTYGDGSIYGKRSETLPFVYPISEELFDCKVITNRLTDPSIVWISGTDFIINREYKVIQFKHNPLTIDGFSQQTLDDGDLEAILWLCRPSIDKQYVYTHFGYVVSLWAKTSQHYKDLVNNVFDSLVWGTSSGRTLDAISICTGIPLAKGNETVIDIAQDSRNKLIVTDKNLYKLSLNAEMTVSVGDVLKEDQSLTSAFKYYEFNRGEVPDDINGLGLHKDLLPGNFVSELGFENKDLPTAVSSDLNGKTIITFPVGGHPFDVDAFWDEVHARGLASGTTLAETLDTRETKVGQPYEASLPTTINPFAFMVSNFLRYGALLVRIKAEAVDPDAAGINKLSYVKRLMPPHSTMILFVELPSVEEDQTADEDNSITSFRAANTLDDEITAASVQDIITARVVRGYIL